MDRGVHPNKQAFQGAMNGSRVSCIPKSTGLVGSSEVSVI
jgi:hypothetical protein